MPYSYYAFLQTCFKKKILLLFCARICINLIKLFMMNEREFLSDFFEWISFRMLKWYNVKTRWNLILTQNIFMFRRCTLVYAVIFHAALDIHRIRSYNSWHISIFCSLEKFKVSKTILILSFISIASFLQPICKSYTFFQAIKITL